MRNLWLLLALAGCAASPPTNTTTEQAPRVPQAPPQRPTSPQGPAQTASSDRAAIEANEEPFRNPGILIAHLGEEVGADGVAIRPLEVVEDSRCPVDATCVWAGRVRVRVRVTGRGGGTAEAVMEIDRPVAILGGLGRTELKAPQEHPGSQQLILRAVAPLNWVRPPADVDPSAPKRFAFVLMD